MDITFPDHFCNVTRPGPSQDVTDMYMTMVLERNNVHVVKMGHKVFYANYVCMFIYIYRSTERKPIQNLVNIYYVVLESIRAFSQTALIIAHTCGSWNYTVSRRSNLSSRLHTMLGLI